LIDILPQLQPQNGTALVLSGGATKAFYFHLGVLKVLLKHEDITSIIGASAGSMVGAFIASGASVDSIISSLYHKKVYIPKFDVWLKTLSSSRLFRPKLGQLTKQSLYTGYTGLRFLASLPMMLNRDILAEILDELIESQSMATGFFNSSALEDLFKNMLLDASFRNTDIDLYVTATALDSQHRAVFNSHYDFENKQDLFMSDVPIHRAIRASTAIPGMFDPVSIKGRYFIDGEIKRTLSTDIGISLSDRIIVSHTYQPLYMTNGGSVRDMGWFNILRQSIITVLHERINRWRDLFEQQQFDKTIIWIHPEPDDVDFFKAPEFSFRPVVQKRLIDSGERAAQRALAQVRV
jgi:NTE family protein